MKKNSPCVVPFAATRKHHSSELAEDYVEIISDLITLKNEAKIRDIAAHLGVSHVTVIRTVERLKKKGYVFANPRGPITLTPLGAQLAAVCKERHLFLMKYLMALGVSESVAAVDVEGMEHHISQETLEAFQKNLKFLEQNSAKANR